MSKEEFPKKATEDNLSDLVEKAEKIKKRDSRLMLVVVCLYALIGLFLVIPLVFYGLGWLLTISSPELSTEMFNNVFLATFFIAMPFAMYLLLDMMIFLFKRFLGLPKSEEKVFAGCFIIANHLMNNEKTKAIKEVNDFLTYLAQFRADINNRKRKAYSPEFKLLKKGKTQIHRMILFSKEKVSDMFMKFGLSFVRGEDQEAYSNLTELVKEVREYGEPKGRVSEFLVNIRRIRILFLFVTVIIELIIVVLKILGF